MKLKNKKITALFLTAAFLITSGCSGGEESDPEIEELEKEIAALQSQLDGDNNADSDKTGSSEGNSLLSGILQGFGYDFNKPKYSKRELTEEDKNTVKQLSEQIKAAPEADKEIPENIREELEALIGRTFWYLIYEYDDITDLSIDELAGIAYFWGGFDFVRENNDNGHEKGYRKSYSPDGYEKAIRYMYPEFSLSDYDYKELLDESGKYIWGPVLPYEGGYEMSVENAHKEGNKYYFDICRVFGYDGPGIWEPDRDLKDLYVFYTQDGETNLYPYIEMNDVAALRKLYYPDNDFYKNMSDKEFMDSLNYTVTDHYTTFSSEGWENIRYRVGFEKNSNGEFYPCSVTKDVADWIKKAAKFIYDNRGLAYAEKIAYEDADGDGKREILLNVHLDEYNYSFCEIIDPETLEKKRFDNTEIMSDPVTGRYFLYCAAENSNERRFDLTELSGSIPSFSALSNNNSSELVYYTNDGEKITDEEMITEYERIINSIIRIETCPNTLNIKLETARDVFSFFKSIAEGHAVFSGNDNEDASYTIDRLKNSRNEDYPGGTYGEAFEKFFTDPCWKYYTGVQLGPDDDGDGQSDFSRKNIDLIEFTGKCIVNNASASMLVQFIDIDGEYIPTYLSVDGKPQNHLALEAFLCSVFKNSSDTGNSGAGGESSADTETQQDFTGKWFNSGWDVSIKHTGSVYYYISAESYSAEDYYYSESWKITGELVSGNKIEGKQASSFIGYSMAEPDPERDTKFDKCTDTFIIDEHGRLKWTRNRYGYDEITTLVRNENELEDSYSETFVNGADETAKDMIGVWKRTFSPEHTEYVYIYDDGTGLLTTTAASPKMSEHSGDYAYYNGEINFRWRLDEKGNIMTEMDIDPYCFAAYGGYASAGHLSSAAFYGEEQGSHSYTFSYQTQQEYMCDIMQNDDPYVLYYYDSNAREYWDKCMDLFDIVWGKYFENMPYEVDLGKVKSDYDNSPELQERYEDVDLYHFTIFADIIIHTSGFETYVPIKLNLNEFEKA